MAPLARLRSNIERITKSVNADWGIYIKCIETGEEIAINADRQMDTMSVIKITLEVWYSRKTFGPRVTPRGRQSDGLEHYLGVPFSVGSWDESEGECKTKTQPVKSR